MSLYKRIYSCIYSIVFLSEYSFLFFFLFSFLLVPWKMEDYMSTSEGWKLRCVDSQLWRKSIFFANFSSRQCENNFWPLDTCMSFFLFFICYTYRLFSQQTYSSGLCERERARVRKDDERYMQKLFFSFKPIYADKQRFCFAICFFFRGKGRDLVLFLIVKRIYVFEKTYFKRSMNL